MLAVAEQQLEGSNISLGTANLAVSRYRRWWLNDYHFIKVLLTMIPNPQEVAHIAESSHARYASDPGLVDNFQELVSLSTVTSA